MLIGLLGILSSAADAAINIFGGGGTSTKTVVERVFAPITDLVAFLQSLFTREYDAWKGAEQDIKHGSAGYGEAAFAQRIAFDRLLNVIIPGSLSWLDGRTHQWVDLWIDTTFWPWVHLENQRWENQWHWNVYMFDWRQNWVDPNINDWRNWHAWFTGWPKQMIEWIHSWWLEPRLFGFWATPIIAWQLPSYLNRAEHLDLRRIYADIIYDTAVDVKYHVEAAAVAVLQSEGW